MSVIVQTPKARPNTTRYSEARKLCERLVRGSIDPERVRLAAYLGSPAARIATGLNGDASPPPSTPWHARRALSQWFCGLRGWGKETWVRAAIACAELALPCYERRQPEDQGPRRALDAAIRWLRCPCPQHAKEAGQAVRDAAHASMDFSACAALRAAQATATHGATSLSHARHAAEDAAWVASCTEAVQARVRLALVPWALNGVSCSSHRQLSLAG